MQRILLSQKKHSRWAMIQPEAVERLGHTRIECEASAIVRRVHIRYQNDKSCEPFALP